MAQTGGRMGVWGLYQMFPMEMAGARLYGCSRTALLPFNRGDDANFRGSAVDILFWRYMLWANNLASSGIPLDPCM